MTEFTFMDIYGKSECECSMEHVNFQILITPKSIKVICSRCKKERFYRRVIL